MRRLRHIGVLLGEILRYSVVNRMWWPLPVVGTLLFLGLIVAGGSAAAPFIYTLF